MNITFRKVAVMSAVVALTAAALTSCSTSSSNTSASKDLNVAFWDYGPSAEQNNKALADGFEKANKGTKVTLTPVAGENWGTYYANVATLMASGKHPDLMLISGEGTQFLAKNNLVVPINDYLKKDKALTADIAPGLINGFKAGNEIVGLPSSWQNMLIYYNTDDFKAAGIAPPSADWTWDDFVATAKKLTVDKNGDGTPDQYGFTWASNEIYPGIMPWVANAGGNLTDDKVCNATVDSAPVVKAVTFLDNLIKEKIAPAPMPMSDVFTRFKAGTIAMFGAGRWPITSFVPGFTAFDVQLYPKGDTYKTVFGGNSYPILKSSKNPDLAWEFQKYTVSTEIQDKFVGTAAAPGDSIPSLRSVADKIVSEKVLPSNSHLFYDSIDKYPQFSPYPAPPKYSQYESTILRSLQLIFSGEKTPEDGLKSLQTELQPIVACS